MDGAKEPSSMPHRPPRRTTVDPTRFDVDRALLHRGGPDHAWGNLGDWSRARTYAAACEALATRVGEAAGLGVGAAVLEVACGEGEGLRLWLERFAVAHATGLELDPRQVASARTRLSSLGLAERARVEGGDAIDLSCFADGAFDAVVCVDAAYHFDPRERFLAEAARVLRDDGRLALTDLVLTGEANGRGARATVALAARACAIPRGNLLTTEAYVARLERAGWRDVFVERLDAAVLAGFAAFVRAHHRAYGDAARGWAKLLVTAWAAALSHRRRWVHYVVVAARAPRTRGSARSSAARVVS
jgi:cyclopropane fatty-acyl-phospholipid synthase-like methyltransferase